MNNILRFTSLRLLITLVLGLSMAIGFFQFGHAADSCVEPTGAGGCFTTIQGAINAAANGDTINVAAGTYNETINIDTRANLTIIGEDPDTTIIKSSTLLGWNVSTYGTSRKTVLRVVNSTGIAINDLTFDLDLVKANAVYGGLFWNSAGSLNGNTFKNNQVPDASGGYYEIGLYLRALAPSYTDVSRASIVLNGNTFKDMGRVSILIHDFVNATIEGNTIYKSADDFGYGIELGSASTGVISGNTIYGFDTPALSDNSGSAGIYIENAFTNTVVAAIAKNVTINDNDIYGNQKGLHIGNEFNGYAGNVDIIASITGNDFHDNVEGAVLIADEDKAAGSSVTANFINNTFTNNGQTGFYLYTFGDGDLTVDIQGGTITGHDVGVYMNDFASGVSASSYNVKVENVQITGNTTYGIQNEYAGAVVDASPNWWGTSSGPGGQISGNVEATLWCANLECSNPPPPLPSSFYGEIYFLDNPPSAGQFAQVYIEGILDPVATAEIKGITPLNYVINIPGDLAGTPAKEGGAENDILTFKINGRMVATSVWHSGTNVQLDFHPPEALPGGPYSGNAGAAISFSGSANDWGGSVASTYQWDWNNDGAYDETGQNPSHTWANFGTYTVGLKVTDSQGGVGTATVDVSVSQISVTVTADAGQNKIFGAADPVFTYTSSESGVVFSGSLSRVSGDDVGIYAITQGSLSAGSNYIVTFVPANFEITPKPITVTADSGQNKVFGAADPVFFTYTSSESGVVFSGSLSREPGANVGSYAITLGTLSAGSNYSLNLVSSNFTITPASATITLSGLTQTYDGNPKSVTAVTNPLGLSVNITYNGSPTAPTVPGSYAVVATIANPNFSGSTTGTLTILTTHSITLEPGWNLISFNLHPTNTNISNVLSSLAGNYDLVYAWDATGSHSSSGNWMKYAPAAPAFSNTLGTLDEKMGFWIHMTSAGALNVVGSIPVITDVNLSVNAGGWNLVAYPSVMDRALPSVLVDHGVGTDFSLVYAYHANNATDPWMLFGRTSPVWANDLTELAAGWGYWVKVSADHTWSVKYLEN